MVIGHYHYYLGIFFSNGIFRPLDVVEQNQFLSAFTSSQDFISKSLSTHAWPGKVNRTANLQIMPLQVSASYSSRSHHRRLDALALISCEMLTPIITGTEMMTMGYSFHWKKRLRRKVRFIIFTVQVLLS